MEGIVPTVGQAVQGAWCACVRFHRSMDSAGLGSVLLAELIRLELGPYTKWLLVTNLVAKP